MSNLSGPERLLSGVCAVGLWWMALQAALTNSLVGLGIAAVLLILGALLWRAALADTAPVDRG